jgi:hypothetical protein
MGAQTKPDRSKGMLVVRDTKFTCIIILLLLLLLLLREGWGQQNILVL